MNYRIVTAIAYGASVVAAILLYCTAMFLFAYPETARYGYSCLVCAFSATFSALSIRECAKRQVDGQMPDGRCLVFMALAALLLLLSVGD